MVFEDVLCGNLMLVWVWLKGAEILTNEDKDLVMRISEEHGDRERLKDRTVESAAA